MKETLLERLQRRGDGRNVDAKLGILEGEGSHQQVKSLEGAFPVRPQVDGRATQAGPAGPVPSYYGQPSLKAPVWKGAIPLYFFTGGLAGASSALGAALDVVGDARLKRLGGRCRALGVAGVVASTGLLIYDLGRPTRFLNMLRVFRPTSPMSVGSWVLSGAGATGGVAFLLRHQRGALGRVGDVAGVACGLLGLPLSGYTAVLISNTAVPLWKRTRRTLPLLFMASGVASAAAALELLPMAPRERRVVRVFGTAGRVAELVAAEAVEREAKAADGVARPLEEGRTGALWKAAKVAAVAGTLLSLLPGRQRWKTVAASSLTLAGALGMRCALFYGGKRSAADPHATFVSQRQGFGAAEVVPAGQVAGPAEKPFSLRLPVLP